MLGMCCATPRKPDARRSQARRLPRPPWRPRGRARGQSWAGRGHDRMSSRRQRVVASGQSARRRDWPDGGNSMTTLAVSPACTIPSCARRPSFSCHASTVWRPTDTASIRAAPRESVTPKYGCGSTAIHPRIQLCTSHVTLMISGLLKVWVITFLNRGWASLIDGFALEDVWNVVEDPVGVQNLDLAGLHGYDVGPELAPALIELRRACGRWPFETGDGDDHVRQPLIIPHPDRLDRRLRTAPLDVLVDLDRLDVWCARERDAGVDRPRRPGVAASDSWDCTAAPGDVAGASVTGLSSEHPATRAERALRPRVARRPGHRGHRRVRSGRRPVQPARRARRMPHPGRPARTTSRSSRSTSPGWAVSRTTSWNASGEAAASLRPVPPLPRGDGG